MNDCGIVIVEQHVYLHQKTPEGEEVRNKIETMIKENYTLKMWLLGLEVISPQPSLSLLQLFIFL